LFNCWNHRGDARLQAGELARKEFIMTETAFIERDIIAPAEIGAAPGRTPFSWSAAIAGAFAATAVTLIIIALGSGIGLSFASPYGSGPSATSLTVAAAVWLVMAQAMGFATGGYLAARLRSPTYDAVVDETTFRDGAQGFMVWAIGVVVTAILLGLLALYSLGAAAQVATGAAAGTGTAARSETASGSSATAPLDYFVDLVLRPGAGAPSDAATVGARAAPLDAATRAEVMRIMARGVSQGQLDDNDRAYLAQVVSARAGLPRDEAERRVADVETRARDAVKEAADKTAKAGAMFSFWTFMSLLFGAAAATLAGVLGGQLRDSEGRGAKAEAGG
jgi:hypothetical protein